MGIAHGQENAFSPDLLRINIEQLRPGLIDIKNPLLGINRDHPLDHTGKYRL